ncbi:hypothetical protein SAMN04490207_2451 [Pseudomonas gessardii]|nr:hypothetical protein SAMN04490207_2451 [Pseudomonas gessardii]
MVHSLFTIEILLSFLERTVHQIFNLDNVFPY